MTSSSPRRSRSNNGEEDRPRFFDSKAKSRCWANAEVVPGRHPVRWLKDAAGNTVCKRFCNCQGCLCSEYDHIFPFSKGLFHINPIFRFHFSSNRVVLPLFLSYELIKFYLI
ncbi:two-component response regulator-like APRR1-like [Hibiscus syriacus]|uniref:Two-component response regulator-like APRR1-like n=1 Tax=Hibiscus syriacus TaxID=106335 RepID=A0A6A2XI34_HIBSY|nr:two-component response regulator-like APRR1-like [Hibiscus syriacus]